jgi:two-component system response regulator
MSSAALEANSHVLVVDDLEDDVLLLTRALRKGGVTNPIDSLENGSLAVEHLKERLDNGPGHELPALVLLDIKMPNMDGHEVLEWIRSQPPLRELPVYMLSSSAVREDIARAESSAASGYWVKPSSQPEYNDLVAKVKNALHQQ